MVWLTRPERLWTEVWRQTSLLAWALTSVIAVSITPCAADGHELTQDIQEKITMIPKVVFVIADGIPADVIERVATPTLDQIAAAGGYGRAYVGGPVGSQAESPTVSATGYMGLITGTWANKHGVMENYDLSPNYAYWDIFRLAKNANPALTTALYSTWTDNRTVLLGEGLEEAGGHKLDYVVDGFEKDKSLFPDLPESERIKRIDEKVADAAAISIREQGPDLAWVYLQYTDDVGHDFGDSAEMDAAVEWVDEQVAKIWNAVESRQQSAREDWLVIVTTDHGRDEATGRDHGGQTERERTTWIVTNNQRLQPAFYTKPAIVDIYPSIADHLQLDIPETVRQGLDGSSFIAR